MNATAHPGSADAIWCQDFLIEGGIGPGGSCCNKDDEWEAWCKKVNSPGVLGRRYGGGGNVICCKGVGGGGVGSGEGRAGVLGGGG